MKNNQVILALITAILFTMTSCNKANSSNKATEVTENDLESSVNNEK
jgi:hypothetical protein